MNDVVAYNMVTDQTARIIVHNFFLGDLKQCQWKITLICYFSLSVPSGGGSETPKECRTPKQGGRDYVMRLAIHFYTTILMINTVGYYTSFLPR